jgi:S-adenosylmethionine:tRNA ribosyltransferase-isomerase
MEPNATTAEAELERTLTLYGYALPQDRIAASPASPRDSAKLFVYSRATKGVTFSTFRDITDFLPENAVLVLNETKVLPARMELLRESGGKIEALCLGTENGCVRTLATGKLKVGEELRWEAGNSFTVMERNEREALLKPSFPVEELPSLLETYGFTPLPPYLDHSPLSEKDRRREYQTVFARDAGSVAAPTAGLHFTDALLQKIKSSGRDVHTVTLHVGLGTFAPLEAAQLEAGALHRERYTIDPKTAAALNAAKDAGRPIVAVGTTVVRTLESATVDGRLQKLDGETTLFLKENSQLHFVDALITNFHVPRSSLLMLVSAFTGRKTLLDLYEKALRNDFRFLSFGDGMLIL